MVAAGGIGIGIGIGTGLAIARAFVREGARVAVCDVDAAALAALTSSDPTLHGTPCDVSQREQVAQWFGSALTHHWAGSIAWSTTPASPGRQARSTPSTPKPGTAASPST